MPLSENLLFKKVNSLRLSEPFQVLRKTSVERGGCPRTPRHLPPAPRRQSPFLVTSCTSVYLLQCYSGGADIDTLSLSKPLIYITVHSRCLRSVGLEKHITSRVHPHSIARSAFTALKILRAPRSSLPPPGP